MDNSVVKPDILIIDDDASLSEMLQMHIDDMGLRAEIVHNGAQARDFLDKTPVRLILLDQHLPDTLGIKLLSWLKSHHPKIDVIMVTGFHEMDLVISAMKAGALDYIHKPIDTEKLDDVIQRALKKKMAQVALKPAPDIPEHDGVVLIGNSRPMLEVGKQIATAAQNYAPVLIRGASGTGKELVAHSVHEHSGVTGPFIAINCASIVETLLESELFGHEKGAFTGAERLKKGKFEVAENGTLFLDEIGEMSPHLQAKILRVLQEQTFERVGGTASIQTNARIIAATHRDLNTMVKDNSFREDLLFRLDVISINLPPLKERMDDFEPIVAHILRGLNKKLGKHIQGLTADALHALKNKQWPGNIRELENTLTRLVAHSRDPIITLDNVKRAPNNSQPQTQLQNGDTPTESSSTAASSLQTLQDVEKAHILNVYKTTNQHKGRTCEILEISRPALDRRLKKWGLT